MSIEYTADSQDIFLLNGRNIANDVSVDAGRDMVPSQTSFKERYVELSGADEALRGRATALEEAAEALDGKIDDVSAAADAKFLEKAGGTIDHLSVAGGLTAGGGLEVRGEIDTDFVKANSTGDIRITGAGEHNHGSIAVDVEGGMNSVSVGGASLSAWIRGSIEALNEGPFESAPGSGKIVERIGQTAGRVGVAYRDILSSDIPLLHPAQVENLTSDYATKQYARGVVSGISAQYDDTNRRIWIVNPEAGLSSWIDANRFIKDGMIKHVSFEYGGEGHPAEQGPYLRIIWNTDAQAVPDEVWLPIRTFVTVYRAGEDSGILEGQLSSDYKIGVDWNEVARKAPVDQLLGYAAALSAPAVGAIDVLSAAADDALSSNRLGVKFLGHVELFMDDAEPRPTFRQILSAQGLLDEEDRVLNGSMYEVRVFEDNTGRAPSKGRYATGDLGFDLGDGDYVYVHAHGLDKYVYVQRLVPGDAVYLADPVHKYDVEELRQFALDNFAKLSGDNVVSAGLGGNAFIGDVRFLAGDDGGKVTADALSAASLTAESGYAASLTADAASAVSLTADSEYASNLTAESVSAASLTAAAAAVGATASAAGAASLAAGNWVSAVGAYSFAQGEVTLASGHGSRAGGLASTAAGDYSVADGVSCVAEGLASRAEGDHGRTGANAVAAHAEGMFTAATGIGAHAEGTGGEGFLGDGTSAAGAFSHTEGVMNQTAGFGSHAEGIFASDGGNNFSFVWQGYKGSVPDAAEMADLISGDGSGAVGKLSEAWQQLSGEGAGYQAKGNGTFCVNPAPQGESADPATGFFVGDESLADRTGLTPIYGDPDDATWVCSPETYDGSPVVVLPINEAGVFFGWTLNVGAELIGSENSANLTWPAGDNATGAPVTATRTDAPISYQLGTQSDRKLATAEQGAKADAAMDKAEEALAKAEEALPAAAIENALSDLSAGDYPDMDSIAATLSALIAALKGISGRTATP